MIAGRLDIIQSIMHRHFEIELKELKAQILRMGGDVENAIELATRALIDKRPDLLRQVHEIEDRINREHMEVDETCVQLLARQSPLAADLRFVVAILKISTDLERMGDQAVNIAHNTREYLEASGIGIQKNVQEMATEVRKMTRNALDAFVNGDVAMAQTVLDADDKVDNLKDKVFQEMIKHMTTHSSEVEQALDMILIARNLERVGDHATNIAEDVIFAVSGKDIRHGSR